MMKRYKISISVFHMAKLLIMHVSLYSVLQDIGYYRLSDIIMFG